MPGEIGHHKRANPALFTYTRCLEGHTHRSREQNGGPRALGWDDSGWLYSGREVSVLQARGGGVIPSDARKERRAA